MDFLRKFWQAFKWKPEIAIAALYWQLTRRRVRALNTLRDAARLAPYLYHTWLEEIEDAAGTVTRCPAIIARWDRPPRLTILAPRSDLSRLAADFERQCYKHYSLHDLTEGASLLSASNDQGYFLVVEKNVRLPPTALFHFAEAIQRLPHAAAWYGDTDEIDGAGKRSNPWLKPDWNREMFLSQDYISVSCVLSAAAFRLACDDYPELGQGSWSARVTASLLQAEAQIVHVPKITAHVLMSDENLPQDFERISVLTDCLGPEGAKVEAMGDGTTKVIWPLPDKANRPLVSIIIPTRDRVDLLRTCIQSVTELTTYDAFELLVIDNGSTDSATLSYLLELDVAGRARILRDESPYNFAQLNNRAAAQVNGTLLCFLNNDTEVLEPDWLTALVRQAMRPHVGAAGAKLLYPDGRIQHAGIVIGMGQAAGHAHRFAEGDSTGYFMQPQITRYVSAVTAACLVVSKAKFRSVGGFDEKDFAIAYNDVDLCLKLQQAGWHNVYVHNAVLRHHESVSRGNDLSAEHSPRYLRELAALQKKWSTKTIVDPYHHPDLDRSQESFRLRLW